MNNQVAGHHRACPSAALDKVSIHILGVAWEFSGHASYSITLLQVSQHTDRKSSAKFGKTLLKVFLRFQTIPDVDAFQGTDNFFQIP